MDLKLGLTRCLLMAPDISVSAPVKTNDVSNTYESRADETNRKYQPTLL